MRQAYDGARTPGRRKGVQTLFPGRKNPHTGAAESRHLAVGWAFVVPREPSDPPMLAELPLTPVFKVDKRALRERR